jgi:hypothetical protein
MAEASSIQAFPKKVVEHVFNVLETRHDGHVENVPHALLGLL